MDTQGEAVSFSLFTKHWKDQSAPELARFVTGIGFDGIESPVRSGFPVEPERVGRDLPEFAKQLREYGVSIFSVAAPVNEAVFAACAEAGIPMIRIMIGIGQDGYKASELRAKQELEDWSPLCERYGVKLGVQPHCGNYVSDVNGLMRIIEAYPPAYVGAIWDAAHDALAGQRRSTAWILSGLILLWLI
ncbi:sugar phosphate isomerase/epimerase [Paenibacillus sp. P25]|nr:sugar phosphate isomerase/epimerase [Paenibacillus sp. P25]